VSVRVCYLTRGTLGASLRALRLVGHSSDERWPEGGHPADIEHGAAWVRQRLSAVRSANSLALLCLDVEGSVCSWLNAPAGNPALVAALARGGTLGDPDAPLRAGTSPVEFYAGDAYASSIQPLDRGSAELPRRTPVLSVGDVPARLLLDALDRLNVSVEASATLWHVMAHAWDPGAPRAGAPDVEPAPGDGAPISGVVLVDAENARLLWTWSRAGRLLVAGSSRLRRPPADAALATTDDAAEPQPTISYGPDDVSRLTVEWLSWAAQVGQAPSRFVCILPDAAQAGPLGRAIGQAWTGASVDVVVRPDPVGETLARAVTQLENRPSTPDDDPQLALVELSSRPGKSHRRLYMWWSAAVAAAALALGVFGWQLNASAARAEDAAALWVIRTSDAIKEVMPDARPAPNRSTFDLLKDEVTRRKKELQRPNTGTEVTMPILQELETISFVVGNNGFELESIDLDSRTSPGFTVITNTTQEAEELATAIRRVAGSKIESWTTEYRAVQSRKEGEGSKVRARFIGQWERPSGGSR
jgi:hypothetical protein